MRILDKFLSSLPKSKALTTTSMLRAEERKGQFATPEEYEARLREFIEEVGGDDPSVFFELRVPIPNTKIFSASFNDMLTRAQGDLEALFTELDNMLEIARAHEEIFQKQALHDLRHRLRLLEEKVNLFEFLSGDPNGFTYSLWNTFSDGAKRLPRRNALAHELYTDLRTNQIVRDDLAYDAVAQALTLPSSAAARKPFAEVEVLDGVVDPWSGRVTREILEETITGWQYSDNVWVFKTLNSPLVNDPDFPIVFSRDEASEMVSPANGYFGTEVLGALPAAPGQYLVVYDADTALALSAVVPGAQAGEIYFWNARNELYAIADAVIGELQLADRELDVLADALLIDAGERVCFADAVLIDEGTCTADAVLVKFDSSHDFGTVSYGYTVDAGVSHKGDLPGSPVTADVRNMLDDTQDTYWFDLILKDEKVAGGILSRLKFNFPGPQEINYVDIDPATRYPFLVERLSYITTGGNRVTLVQDHPTEIIEPTRFYFNKVRAAAVVLEVRQKNCEVHTYDLRTGDSLLEIISSDQSRENLDLYREAVQEGLGNTKLYELLNLSPDTKARLRTVYEYIYGLDSVTAGLLDLEETGIYVSEGSEPLSVGLVGLETVTSQPPGGLVSFEHVVTKRDFDRDGAMIGSHRFPMLDFGATSVSNERLIPDDNWIARTRLRAHGQVTDGNAAARLAFCTLKVYQNGVEIAEGVRWSLTNNDAASDPHRYTEIQLSVNAADVREVNAIYTVSYNPLYTLIADKRDYHIDTAKSLRRRADGLVETSGRSGEREIYNSQVYLTSMQRINHMHNRTSVAELREFRLHVGERFANRFASIG